MAGCSCLALLTPCGCSNCLFFSQKKFVREDKMNRERVDAALKNRFAHAQPRCVSLCPKCPHPTTALIQRLPSSPSLPPPPTHDTLKKIGMASIKIDASELVPLPRAPRSKKGG